MLRMIITISIGSQSVHYDGIVGVEFASKNIVIDENYRVKLQIWDTAGQESFQAIVKSFYRSASAVILVYNITKYGFKDYF
jgi:Ras-related protein Rab-2A